MMRGAVIKLLNSPNFSPTSALSGRESCQYELHEKPWPIAWNFSSRLVYLAKGPSPQFSHKSQSLEEIADESLWCILRRHLLNMHLTTEMDLPQNRESYCISSNRFKNVSLNSRTSSPGNDRVLPGRRQGWPRQLLGGRRTAPRRQCRRQSGHVRRRVAAAR